MKTNTLSKWFFVFLTLSMVGCNSGQSSKVVWLAVGQSNMSDSFIYGIDVAATFASSFENSVALNAGIGGTKIECWVPEGACWKSRIQPLIDMGNFSVDGVLWWQGESDALNVPPTNPEDYKRDLVRFFEALREGFKTPDLPILVVELQVLGSPEVQSTTDLRAAQREAVESLSDVYLVPTTDITYFITYDDGQVAQGATHPGPAYPGITERLVSKALELGF